MPFQPANSGIKRQRFQQVQRQLHAVGFFGVDVQADIVLFGQHQQFFRRGSSSFITRSRWARL